MVIEKAIIGSRTYRIDDDFPEIGAYLRVFERDVDLCDYLQDDVQACKDFAMEEYGVPIDAWQSAEE